ncbi:MAG: hypothetical protein DM484_08090 [Candidatus Methylumidiphilus alinenensis]|uniref:Uncharacterized protein n=1 Tax=Candidatus Methylumidiphilus alinenensis TaxID=2202197 RepID=A0A2W4RCL5_9GAMM|nr:MAG: hypothetical protein DM484_08090 [Candidatus Methylumidiphilus alinenensis]
MFGTMTNATAPTAHLGQRRGVISGGSFYFINMNQFVNLMRAVASNAAGYASLPLS